MYYFVIRLVVDDKRRIGYCLVPKAASTTWAAVMANNTQLGRNLSLEKLYEKGRTFRGIFRKTFKALKQEKYVEKIL